MQLEDSPAFLAVPGEKNQDSHCVCRNEQKTLAWAVTPKSLGEWWYWQIIFMLEWFVFLSDKIDPSPPFAVIRKRREEYCQYWRKLKKNKSFTYLDDKWMIFWESSSPGKMNFTATAEAMESQEQCAGETPQVPTIGWKDTVIKPLLVEVGREILSSEILLHNVTLSTRRTSRIFYSQ